MPPLPAHSRIAIIGAGISGLTAAYLLADRHDITVFEAGDYAGGHTNTVTVDLDGTSIPVDTGFIVFNNVHYPNFSRLLDELDVESRPSSMSFSVRCEETGLEYNGTSLNGLFAQRRNLARPAFLGMVRDILRFHRDAPSLLDETGEDLTVEAYLARERYGRWFGTHYLVPIGASIWSCPATTFRRFPMRFVVEFMRNHHMLQVGGRPQWRTVTGGARRYVEAMTRGFRDRIRLDDPVGRIRRDPDGVRLATAAGRTESFDHVIVATHADQAVAMLEDPTGAERQVLGAFPYQENEAVLHTDPSVLPRRRRAWAAWNYHRRRDDPDRVAITYNMNILQSLPTRRVVNVTLNDAGGVDPSTVLRRISYTHPVFTPGRAQAQARHGELIGRNRTSYCGAYWGYGFHEDGVRSALAVCRELGRAWP